MKCVYISTVIANWLVCLFVMLLECNIVVQSMNDLPHCDTAPLGGILMANTEFADLIITL